MNVNPGEEDAAAELRETLHALLGPLDRQALCEIEREVTWIKLRRGEYLACQGEAATSFYLVLGGCLDVISDTASPVTAPGANRVRRGQCIGDLQIITGTPWGAGLRAVRDSVLARFDAATFSGFCQRHPRALQRVAKLACQRLQNQAAGRAAIAHAVRGVVVVPLHPAANGFASLLKGAIGRDALHLTGEHLAALFPHDENDEPRDAFARSSAWMDRQELAHVALFYEADPMPSAWTKRCVERADHVLFVASAQRDAKPGELEQRVREWATAHQPPRMSLVLIHADDETQPTGTSRWLQCRALDSVFHVRANHEGDIGRLGRILSGRAVGLALGGGGSRGLAHVGVIRALEEAGIPIDMVGGTSVGAVVAAQFASGMRWDAMLEAFTAFARMKPHRDYTLPLTGLIRGRTFDRMMRRIFHDSCLEDLRINCFGVSTDLSSSAMVVHERGLVRHMVRASCALPGIAVPAVEDGRVFVDGGVLNSLPCDVMRERCGTVIAVDVSPLRPLTVNRPDGQLPSPWAVLCSWLNPFQQSIAVPTIGDVIERAMALGSRERKVKAAADADLYLCPPVEHFRTLDIRAFDQILETGYRYAQEQIERWRRESEPCTYQR